MKIALIWPKSTFLIEPMYYPPLGLWYVWAALKQAKMDVDFFDCAEDELPLEGYDQYWVSGTSPQASQLREISNKLRRNVAPKSKLVVGGPHAWMNPELMTEQYDTVIVGEVFTSTQVWQALTGWGVVNLGLDTSLEGLPLPIRDAAHRYKALLDGRACTTMITSLGCPYRCAFCSSPDLWGKVRYIPLTTVEADIKQCARLGFGAIQIYDDILPLKPLRTLQVAEVLAREGMVWRCFTRSDLSVRQGKGFLQQLADLGLVEVLVGVESGSNTIKKNINKGTTQEQDALLRHWCKEVGVRFKASIILGLPGETQETMEATRTWLLTNKPDKADINVLIPMPGTPLYDNAKGYECKWTTELTEEYFFKGKPGELECLVETDTLSSTDILEFRNKLVEEVAIPY